MGRKALFDVKSLKVGEKLAFPKKRWPFLYQYLNNFNRANPTKKFGKVEKDGQLLIERIK
jgi:hypothetical protein